MPKKMEIKFTGDWNGFAALLDPAGFTMRFEREVRRATIINARIIVREIRNEIKSGVPPANARLTLLLKKGNKTLVSDDANLWNAIGHELIDSFTAFVGVIKSGRGKTESELINIAEVLHDGATIKVTNKMRGWFIGMSKQTGGVIKPLKPTTKVIVIPSRPFIRNAIQKDELIRMVNYNWSIAVSNALYNKQQPYTDLRTATG